MGFNHKPNIIWYKTRKDGGPDGRGVGFYFRNEDEPTWKTYANHSAAGRSKKQASLFDV